MIAQTRMQTDRQSSERTWSFPRRMVEDYVSLTTLIALGLFALTMAIAFGIDYWSTLSVSIWDTVVTSAPQWYSAIMAGIIAHTFLPVVISNGKTRRDFAIESAIFLSIYSAVTALLIALGFLLEKGIYAIMDWPHTLENAHMFSSSGQTHLIFGEYLLRILLWSTAGYLVGAGFYRSDAVGGATLAFVWIPMMIAEFVMDARTGSPVALLEFVFERPTFHPLLAVIISLVMLASIGAVAWRVIRDMPLRTTTE